MATKSKTGPKARGEAGQKGEGIRSDLHVSLEARSGGGLDLELHSRVEPYYGESIRSQVISTLQALGVSDALVTVRDEGGLPFVIQARLEAAARRAGFTGGDARPARTVPLPPASSRDRLRRSRLYLPGNEPKFMINAGLHGPDGIILDLEDSVHPQEKDSARILVRNALRSIDFGGSERMVRINPVPSGVDDLEAVIPELVDMILIPKAEDPDQIREVDQAVARILQGAGEDRSVWLMPILETALGIERAFEIAGASRRVASLTLGLEDLTADLGVSKTREGDESLYARMRVINAARAAGVQAIDSVYSDVEDAEGLRAWCERSRGMGFEGMGCLHPRQIRVVHEAYAPGRDEIERALTIVAAFEEARGKGLAVVSLGSKMIDPPVVERARKLVERARASGLVSREKKES